MKKGSRKAAMKASTRPGPGELEQLAGATWQVRPIGVIRSRAKDRKQLPPLGLPATIELFAAYEPGLLHLEKHTHLWVLVWLHASQRDLLQVVPRGVREEEPDALHGVFAVRSPVRPNPIGLTVTRMERIEGRRIHVARLDFVDGTPVLDLKPYFVNRDLVFSASNMQIGRPASRENLRASLLEQAINFHGECCAELAVAVRVMEHFRWEVLHGRDPVPAALKHGAAQSLAGCPRQVSLRVRAPWKRGCLLDGLIGMTRVSPGRGTLELLEGDRVVFEYEGVQWLYELRPQETADAGAILAAADEALFAWRRLLGP
ncbi:MAG: tRNA (N6-threonylcarbamoyladenosine(37)-N6)-methyltransferase TrmO [Bryobacteraceae bacterium]